MLTVKHLLTMTTILAQEPGNSAGPLGIMLGHLLAAIVFSIVGIAILMTSYMVIKRMLPFSITKEIEEDQNTALAIIIGAGIIGMSMIISASIMG